MAEFQELIKNFDRIRDYMRQFYIYGFKARTEFDGKSARTYDNERRRIESWLADYTRADYTSKGKHVYICLLYTSPRGSAPPAGAPPSAPGTPGRSAGPDGCPG